MIWTTWRQHRAEALVVAACLAVLTALLLVTGLQMRDAYQSLGVGPCLDPNNTNISCGQIISSFRDQFGWLQGASGWLNVIPALVAMLIGAPLVAREFERHTYLLAWTQAISRRRWLTTKLVCVIGGALLVSGLLTALLVWWRVDFDTLFGRMAPVGYDVEGSVPFAYMAFALALAIAAGTLLRRAIPAMAVTLLGYLAVRLPIDSWVRAYVFQAPVTLNVSPLSGVGPTRADWGLDFGFVDHSGHAISSSQAFTTCSDAGITAKINFFQCVQAHGWLVSYVYQPADRFWRFQITETLIYLALAALLLGLTYWWTQRRIR